MLSNKGFERESGRSSILDEKFLKSTKRHETLMLILKTSSFIHMQYKGRYSLLVGINYTLFFVKEQKPMYPLKNHSRRAEKEHKISPVMHVTPKFEPWPRWWKAGNHQNCDEIVNFTFPRQTCKPQSRSTTDFLIFLV